MQQSQFSGYPARVFSTCWQSLSWLNGLLTSGTDVSNLYQPVAAVIATIVNGLGSLSAWQIGASLSIEAQNIAEIATLALPIDPITEQYYFNRLTGVTAAANGISALPVTASPFLAVQLLAAGQPAIADPKFIEWCMTFAGESTIGSMITLPTGAVPAATAWLTIANAIYVLQGGNPSTAYDVAARQYRCGTIVSTILNQTTSGPFSAPLPLSAATWSQVVALPTILLDAESLCSSPAQLVSQQCGVIRYVMGTQLLRLSVLLLSLRNYTISQIQTAALRNTESLMDLANRTTGNFENWSAIAALNNIAPPFPGPTNTALAMQGQQLFVSNNGVPSNPGAQQPTYAANVLGTDFDFGPINGQMPAWLGDIPLIGGLLNFARAIGRRLQTPLASLIYHGDYGSRIPAEVGAIQGANEAARLLRYGISAISLDPRTGSISNAQTQLQPGFLAEFSANVVPIGPNAEPAQINEVIGSVP